ncbi:MAG: 1,4-beta-xylanase [Chitinophaga sp.]|jgi:endo-1,4-beta-xylanase|nr:1,4-beta-xylanase [Chitinophaga sp.]
MKLLTSSLLLAVTGSLIIGCNASKKTTSTTSSIPSLRDAYKKDFLIGTALNNSQIEQRDSAANSLIIHQFSAATPENIMKAQIIHPEWDRYNFDLADKLVDFGKKNDIKITAHTLIWHSQLPNFMRNIKSADSVKMYFENHITTVASRYDGKVYSWDVVNEALNEDGTLRNSIFLQKLGPDYIVEAFRLAQKAAPNTKLYYNDYNIEQPKKRAGAIEIIKKIKAAGVRIDGVGIQGHWNMNDVPLDKVEESIKEFSALGVEVMFTELDLSALPNPRGRNNSADISNTAAYNEAINPYTKEFPDSAQQKLAKGYEDLFKLFLKYKKNVSRVTFWGVDDAQSWLNDFPVRGRTNHALLFDRKLQPKQAFYSLINLKK